MPLWLFTIVLSILVMSSTIAVAYYREFYAFLDRGAKALALPGADRVFRKRPSDVLWAAPGGVGVAILALTGAWSEPGYRAPLQPTLDLWNNVTPWAYVAFVVFILAQLVIIKVGLQPKVGFRRVGRAKVTAALWLIAIIATAALVVAATLAGDALLG